MDKDSHKEYLQKLFDKLIDRAYSGPVQVTMHNGSVTRVEVKLSFTPKLKESAIPFI